MNLKKIHDMPPWDWPEDAGRIFKDILDDRSADPSERLPAAEMAGNLVVMDNELAKALIAVVDNNDEMEEMRSRAVISLGPALEHAEIYEFDDAEDIVLSEEVFQKVQALLRKIYYDAGVPKEVRRRVLEAAVRAPLDWHSAAVRAAFVGDDEDWRLTAVFCMRFIKGFDKQILESLESVSPDIQYEAVCAAGNWGVKAAWPHVDALLRAESTDKSLLLAAIDAASGIGLPEAVEIILDFTDSDDDDIVDAAHEALAMIGIDSLDDEYEEEDDW